MKKRWAVAPTLPQHSHVEFNIYSLLWIYSGNKTGFWERNQAHPHMHVDLACIVYDL